MITRELIGKINVNGRLLIQRGAELKPQQCNYKDWTCGDHCPHFGEPRSVEDEDLPNQKELFICGGTVLVFDRLIDERTAVSKDDGRVFKVGGTIVPSVIPELVESLRRTGA